MNVKGLGKNIKQDYLIWGFALSILLTLLGTGCDGYAQAVLVVIFVAISGLISNAIVFMQFVRRYYAFIILMFAWIHRAAFDGFLYHFCKLYHDYGGKAFFTYICW